MNYSIKNLAKFVDTEYNSDVHNTPILWMNSLLLRKIQLTKNEKLIKNLKTTDYPSNSIIVKVAKGYGSASGSPVGYAAINFMGDSIKYSWGNRSIRSRVELYKTSQFAYYDKAGNPVYQRSDALNQIRFADAFRLENLENYLPYLSHIINQINSL